MQKSALQYGEIIFQSKVIPLFLPKCSTIRKCILYMVYCIPYMVDTVGFLPYMVDTVGKKIRKVKHGKMRDIKTVKIATSEIQYLNFSILKRNFTFLHNFLGE